MRHLSRRRAVERVKGRLYDRHPSALFRRAPQLQADADKDEEEDVKLGAVAIGRADVRLIERVDQRQADGENADGECFFQPVSQAIPEAAAPTTRVTISAERTKVALKASLTAARRSAWGCGGWPSSTCTQGISPSTTKTKASG